MREKQNEIISITNNNNIDTIDASKLDKLANTKEIVPAINEKANEAKIPTTQSASNNQKQTKTDQKVEIKDPDNTNLLQIIDSYLNEDRRLPDNIKNRINFAIISLGESEELNNQNPWGHIKKWLSIILKYLTLGLYQGHKKKYNMHLVNSLNERMRKIINGPVVPVV